MYKIKLMIVSFLFMAVSFCSTEAKSRTVATYKIITDSILAPGVIYRNIYIGKGRYSHSVHVIEADLINPFIGACVLKARNQVNELEKLHLMIRKYDSMNPECQILGAINANFWRAYSNRPIGPTVIEGEVVEMITHKKWSSCYFNKIGQPYIDNYYLNGMIILNKQDTLNIRKVNRRSDSTEIVLYNRFGGDTIPHIQTNILTKAFEMAINEAIKDTLINDSTETEMDTLGLLETIKEEKMQSDIEMNSAKLLIRYLDFPAVNKDIKCVVKSFSERGSVMMPQDGAVISLGYYFDQTKLPQKNDTLIIRFSTNVNDSIVFYNSVCGTPRLVRDGIAKHEAIEEGSRGRRFINRALTRTAIGTNKGRTKIYFATIENGNSSKRTRGASLAQLAYVMKQIGCYNAMNLDGGGSSMMVINGRNLNRANPLAGRSISVGLGILSKKVEGYVKPEGEGIKVKDFKK